MSFGIAIVKIMPEIMFSIHIYTTRVLNKKPGKMYRVYKIYSNYQPMQAAYIVLLLAGEPFHLPGIHQNSLNDR